MRGVVALVLRRRGQDEEAGERGIATRLGCARHPRACKWVCKRAGILTVAAQAGAGVLLSDSGARSALLDATSNEFAYAKGYGEIKGGAG